MVVAVSRARVVQVPTDQIIDVFAVRHLWMAARGAVPVACIMGLAGVGRSAIFGMRLVDRDRALVDVVAVCMVQVTIMKIILVIAMGHRSVRTVLAVRMGVLRVHGMRTGSSRFGGHLKLLTAA